MCEMSFQKDKKLITFERLLNSSPALFLAKKGLHGKVWDEE
jgi:hypothetical protein